MRFRDVGSPDFNWFDCWSIIKVELSTQGSPLHKATDEHWQWRDPSFDMLINIFDVQRSIMAYTPRPSKSAKAPKPTRRPWEEARDMPGQKQYGTSIKRSQLDAFLEQWANGYDAEDAPEN